MGELTGGDTDPLEGRLRWATGTGGGVTMTAGDAVLLLVVETVLCLLARGDATGVGSFGVF